jgi:predicted peptidase
MAVKIHLMLRRLLLLAIAVCPLLTAETGFLDRSMLLEGKKYRYQVYVPREYKADRVWPAILFLHGLGQSGTDGLKQTMLGLPAAVREFPGRYPALIVMPQVPETEAWIGIGVRIALAALDDAAKEFRMDNQRLHLTGLSMGGQGVLLTAMEAPGRFASLSILCAGLEFPEYIPPPFRERVKSTKLPSFSELAKQLNRHQSIRFYAGGRDKTTPPALILRTVRGIEEAGIPVRYRELPEANHNVWDPVYRDPEFAEWLMAQRLGGQ